LSSMLQFDVTLPSRRVVLAVAWHWLLVSRVQYALIHDLLSDLR
jgi:hypothetical protein